MNLKKNFYTSNLNSIKKIDKNKEFNTKDLPNLSKDLKPNIYLTLDSKTKRQLNNKKLIGLALVEAVRRIWVNHLRLSDKLPKTINGTNKTIIPFIDDVFIIYGYEGSAVNSYNSLMKINLNRLIFYAQ